MTNTTGAFTVFGDKSLEELRLEIERLQKINHETVADASRLAREVLKRKVHPELRELAHQYVSDDDF